MMYIKTLSVPKRFDGTDRRVLKTTDDINNCCFRSKAFEGWF